MKQNRSIKCLNCGSVSYNENDIARKYCGRCHKFIKDYVINPQRRKYAGKVNMLSYWFHIIMQVVRRWLEYSVVALFILLIMSLILGLFFIIALFVLVPSVFFRVLGL